MTENKQYISDIDETGDADRLAIWVFDRDFNDYLMLCYADETNEIVEVLNHYGKKVKLLKQFRNLANDYNISLGKLCDAFEDCLEENEQLKQSNQELNDKLQETMGYLETQILNLKEKNKQLKNRIKQLEDDNMKYTLSTNKIEKNTKRFIPTKCIMEFKDCKTNHYYNLNNEDNFTGTIELLNILDYKNKQLKTLLKQRRND